VGLALVFMLTEAAVGAALVLFQLVADNPSMARALFMSVHLVNTFILLAWLALTAYWTSGGADMVVRGRGQTAFWLGLGAVGAMLAGASGAVAALGDTLYPSGSLAEALGADLSTTSHILIRLRLLHPAVAVVLALALALAGMRARREAAGTTARLGGIVAALAGIQVVAGFVNVVLLAPVWMQLVHLLLADLLWIAFVLMGAGLLARSTPVSSEAAAQTGSTPAVG
jgi:heme A synthase